jgi:hypothetical protein
MDSKIQTERLPRAWSVAGTTCPGYTAKVRV